MGASRLRWKRYVEKVGFEPGMNGECVMDGESGEQVGDDIISFGI